MEIIQGKNILVVGATGGIGHEAAKLLKQSGANLYLAGRDSQKLLAVAQGLSV
ncbi:MAG: SDR family NAD(P)-dependent oxidoreductase, partial [Bacteroidota bacterium]